MAADPLSTATRTTKRNLLAVSSVLILVKIFNVTVDKIPMSGIEFTFDRGGVMLGIALMTLYFLLAFLTYYAVDIRSLQESAYEKDVRQKYYENLRKFRGVWSIRIAKCLKNYLGDEYMVDVNNSGLDGLLSKSEGLFGVTRISSSGGLPDALKPNVSKYNHIGRAMPAYEATVITYWQTESICCWAMVLISNYKQSFVIMNGYWRLVFFVKVSVHRFRNYIFDGLFPLVMGATALLATYNVVDLSWVKTLVPPIN